MEVEIYIKKNSEKWFQDIVLENEFKFPMQFCNCIFCYYCLAILPENKTKYVD